ncbi:hypothetical protein H696_03055 [Fonticula alba]|uniref:Phosphoinositide phospholipase C n=1 Tax=Fonticula alba TaxID=691883 RepID=A0A058ZB98_FONAL|nr:hypothetical protein H696_03055 [Fonticula alba]KCV70702.1 hypothetical protein H696_03055 [Fonticula alba]|eukprot:XP_009495218.1 hypothetical protein H696_03055 [Fonticula alba]
MASLRSASSSASSLAMSPSASAASNGHAGLAGSEASGAEHAFPPSTPVEAVVSELSKTVIFIKLSQSSRPHERGFSVVRQEHSLHAAGVPCYAVAWSSPNKRSHQTLIEIPMIIGVHEGQYLGHFPKWRRDSYQGRAFSIVYATLNGTSTVDVVAPTVAMRAKWVSGLRRLVDAANVSMVAGQMPAGSWRCDESVSVDRQARAAFLMADRDGDRGMTLEELTRLLVTLNLRVPSASVAALFEKYSRVVDSSGAPVSEKEQSSAPSRLFSRRSRRLDYTSFFQLYCEISSRGDVEAVYRRLLFSESTSMSSTLADSVSTPELPGISRDLFMKFLLVEQQHTEEDAYRICEYYVDHSIGNRIPMDRFASYIQHQASFYDIVNQKVHHDMTRPLTDYWIAAAHNNHHSTDIICHRTPIASLIHALRSGCRMLELDCHDGPGDSPVIHHGRMSSNRVPLAEVLRAIREDGFDSSPYPIFLSLVNHCSLTQQFRMVEIIQEELSGMLATPQFPGGMIQKLPSPEELMHKIIIKAHPLPAGIFESGEPESAFFSDAADDLSSSAETDDDTDDEKDPMTTRSSTTSSSSGGRSRFSRGSSSGQPKRQVSKELSSLVNYCRPTQFQGFEHSKKNHYADNFCTIGERHASRLARRSHAKLVEFTRRQIARVYPLGVRFDTVNIEPHLHWAAGVQMVAMNYQRIDRPLRINHGRFLENGRSGYLLKPRHLLASPPEPTAESSRLEKHWRLTLVVMSGYHLPKPRHEDTTEVIDPYVVMEILSDRSRCFTPPAVNKLPAASQLALEAAQMARSAGASGGLVAPCNASTTSVSSGISTSGSFSSASAAASAGLVGDSLAASSTSVASVPPTVSSSSASVNSHASSNSSLNNAGSMSSRSSTRDQRDSQSEQAAFATRHRRRTRTCSDNGLTPVWGEVFCFDIPDPSVALLHFTIMDKDVEYDDFVATATIPLRCMRPGYRNISLFDYRYEALPTSKLFVHAHIDYYIPSSEI